MAFHGQNAQFIVVEKQLSLDSSEMWQFGYAVSSEICQLTLEIMKDIEIQKSMVRLVAESF
jgi:hypothetical protein